MLWRRLKRGCAVRDHCDVRCQCVKDVGLDEVVILNIFFAIESSNFSD